MIERKKKICKSCGKEVYLYARGLCKFCDALENPDKHGLKIKIPLEGAMNKLNKPRKRINPISEKRKKLNEDYKIARDKYLKDNPKCEAGVVGCLKKSDQIHHKKGRIGELLVDTKHFLAVCGNCHRDIEDNPNWAKEMGFSLNRIN